MIITENTRWTTEYELDNDWVNMTITQYKFKEPIKNFYFVIPIEFYDDVRIWDWEVIPQHSHTPVITTRQSKVIMELTGLRKPKDMTILSLNMITPFMAVFKHKTMVSNKNNNEWKDNDNKCLWYDAGYEDEDDVVADEQWEQACRSFDVYTKRALKNK